MTAKILLDSASPVREWLLDIKCLCAHLHCLTNKKIIEVLTVTTYLAGTNGFDEWISHINKICGPFGADPVADQFVGSIRKVGGALDMSRVVIGGARLYKTQREIAQSGVPGFFCVLQTQGDCRIEQGDNRSLMSAGDLVLVDSSLPFRFSFSSQRAEQISLILPRDIIERILNIGRVAPGVKLPACSHIAQFASKLIITAAGQANLSAEEADAMVASLATLIKPSVLRSLGSTSRYQQVFSAANDYIKAHIHESELNAATIANAVGTSVRSLYRAFAHQSIALSDYIKQQRLSMSADYIRAHYGHLNLTEVAYRFGFASPSYFSTAFKREFGLTPSEFRKRCG